MHKQWRDEENYEEVTNDPSKPFSLLNNIKTRGDLIYLLTLWNFVSMRTLNYLFITKNSQTVM